MIKKFYFLTVFCNLLFFTTTESFAQKNDSVRSQYIREFPDKFNVKGLVTNRNLAISFGRRNNQLADLEYEPNVRRYIGLGGQIFDIGLEFLVKFPKFTQKDTERYGDTKVFDIQANVYGKRLCGDAGIQLYNGFYISNPEDYVEDWNKDDNFPQRNDLKANHIYGNIIYIFNHEKFSLRSGYNHIDRQIKSAGSLMMTTSLSYFGIMGDYNLVPSEYFSTTTTIVNFNNAKFYTLGILPGYSYNFILKDFYINLSIAAGLHIQRQKYDLNFNEKSGFKTDPKINLRYAVGYDNDRFFAGITYFAQQNQFDTQPLYIKAINSNFKVFAGIRIKKSGILKKHSIWNVLEKIGLEQ